MWQEIDGRRHLCHSWQETDGRRITAMTVFLILFAVAAFAALLRGAAYLYNFIADDGYGHLTVHAAPPRSHHRDPFEPRRV
jgi:hypothetical protein